MAKTIYVYLNTRDLVELLNDLMQKGITLFDNVKTRIVDLPFAVKSITEIALYSQDNGCVFFSPCFYVGNQLLWGSLYLTKENYSRVSLNLFSQIKKAVRRKFSYSKDNSCYYGPGFYDDWLNKKFCLPVLLDFDRIELTADKIENLFSVLKSSHFSVKSNNARLRDIDKVDISTSSFIIYSSEDRLVQTIVRKSWVRYEYDSACIFADKNECRGIYSFVFDRRLTNNSFELKVLFERLKSL